MISVGGIYTQGYLKLLLLSSYCKYVSVFWDHQTNYLDCCKIANLSFIAMTEGWMATLPTP